MRHLTFLLVLVFSLPAFPQAKRPFTFDDMMKLKRIGEPEPSPDGKWVLFSAVDVDLAANTKTPHIWIVRLNSGATGVPAGRRTGRVLGSFRRKKADLRSGSPILTELQGRSRECIN
jgi:hypothetical protein